MDGLHHYEDIVYEQQEKTRFLNKEPRSLQKSIFMMSKIKEEKKVYLRSQNSYGPHPFLFLSFYCEKRNQCIWWKEQKNKKKYAAFSQNYYACSPEFSTIKTITYCEPIVLLSP